MKTITHFFALGILACTFGAAANELEDSVKFHVPFEKDCNAVVAEGSEKGDPTGKPVLIDGLYGKAIVCGKGGSAIRFMRQDNIDFDKPGTVNVWFKIDCKHGTAGPAIPFWGIGSDDKRGMLSVGVLNDPMKLCPCRRQIGFLFISKKRPKYARAFAVGTGKRRICSGWHLMSTAWSGNKLYVSLDGTPYRSYELEKPLSNAELGYQKRFAAGVNYARWQYAIDEFMIYGKKLSDMEIAELYQKGMVQLKKKEDNKK